MLHDMSQGKALTECQEIPASSALFFYLSDAIYHWVAIVLVGGHLLIWINDDVASDIAYFTPAFSNSSFYVEWFGP